MWIGQPDSQRTVDVEGGSCVDNTCGSTVVLSVRHITVGVQSVRHITVSVQSVQSRGRCTRNERSRTKLRAWRFNGERGQRPRAYEINQVVDFMRRTSQFTAYRRDVVIGLCHLYKCTSLNVLHWLHLLSIHTEYGNLSFTLSRELAYMRYLLRYASPHSYPRLCWLLLLCLLFFLRPWLVPSFGVAGIAD